MKDGKSGSVAWGVRGLVIREIRGNKTRLKLIRKRVSGVGARTKSRKQETKKGVISYDEEDWTEGAGAKQRLCRQSRVEAASGGYSRNRVRNSETRWGMASETEERGVRLLALASLMEICLALRRTERGGEGGVCKGLLRRGPIR